MKELVLSLKAGERGFKAKALRRCLGSKDPSPSEAIPAATPLSQHRGWTPARVKDSHTVSSDGQDKSTKPTDLLMSVLPLTFMREALRTYC